jgi:LPXTG-site transpeptidase (sortase) family protein
VPAVHHSSSHSRPNALQNLKRKIRWIFLSISLICFLMAGFLMWERYYNPFQLDFFSAPTEMANTGSKIYFLPTQIVIPDLKINLPVIPTQIIDTHWTTTPNGVSYLSASARPGDIGNGIYYGHNWPRLLGNLYKIKVGQTISVYTSNGKTFNYTVITVKRVSPTDISVLNNTRFRGLTIYTCAGFADTQRLVVTAYTQTTAK